MIAFSIAAASCLIWLYLIGARGKFWRVPPSALPSLESTYAPRIAVIVPARNEADVIAQPVLSLLQQDYPGPLHVFVVDDHSSDDTAQLVREAAAAKPGALTIVPAAPLPSGWTGKMWALSQGVQYASTFAPDYFLFTDADIVHASHSVSTSVALAKAGNRDLVSFWLLLATLLGLGITYLAPPVVVFFGGWAALLGAIAWALMTISFVPMVRFYSLCPLWAATLPAIALFYAGATIHSAIQYWAGRGGEWKDRVQDTRPAA